MRAAISGSRAGEASEPLAPPSALRGADHAGPPPAWVRMVSGPNPPAPNGNAELVTNLAPGNYAIVCFVPDDHGVPHFAKGMARPVVVAPRGAPPALPLGGASGMIPGDHATFTMNFTPGNYPLLCFLPGGKDGKEHALHGMVKQIHVS